jgi:transcriptional regulator of acetoin/glycerol metabolism
MSAWQNLGRLYVLKGDKAKANELYGKDFIADQVDNLAYALRSYAEFWAGQNENLASAEAMIEKALRHHGGNVSRAAESLGLSRAALYRRLEKHRIAT